MRLVFLKTLNNIIIAHTYKQKTTISNLKKKTFCFSFDLSNLQQQQTNNLIFLK